MNLQYAFDCPDNDTCIIRSDQYNLCRLQRFSAAYLWGGIARIEIQSSSANCRLVFFGTPKLVVTTTSLTSETAETNKKETGDFGADSVAAQGGLKHIKEVDFTGLYYFND